VTQDSNCLVYSGSFLKLDEAYDIINDFCRNVDSIFGLPHSIPGDAISFILEPWIRSRYRCLGNCLAMQMHWQEEAIKSAVDP